MTNYYCSGTHIETKQLHMLFQLANYNQYQGQY